MLEKCSKHFNFRTDDVARNSEPAERPSSCGLLIVHLLLLVVQMGLEFVIYANKVRDCFQFAMLMLSFSSFGCCSGSHQREQSSILPSYPVNLQQKLLDVQPKKNLNAFNIANFCFRHRLALSPFLVHLSRLLFDE